MGLKLTIIYTLIYKTFFRLLFINFLKFNFFILSKKTMNKDYNSQALKLPQNQELIIKSFYKVNTKYGSSFIIVDISNQKYWSNKTINEYLSVHKGPFKIKTYCYNAFINKEIKEIKYLELIIKPLSDKENDKVNQILIQEREKN